MLSKYGNFRGVFTKDRLPDTISDDEIGVVNFDNSDGNGTHWVAYFNSSGLPENEHVIYFDSYGLPAPEEIKKYLKTSGKKIKYNTGEIQNVDSIMCGYYCIHVLDQLMNGKKFSDILLEFKPFPSKENEWKIKNIF